MIKFSLIGSFLYIFFIMPCYAMESFDECKNELLHFSGQVSDPIEPIVSMVFTNETCLAIGRNKVVSLWDIEKGNCKQKMITFKPIRHVIVPPEDQNLIAVLRDHQKNFYSILLWDQRSGKQEKKKRINKDVADDLWPHVFSLDGRKEFIGHKDGCISCYVEPAGCLPLSNFINVPMEGIREWIKMIDNPSDLTLNYYGQECRLGSPFFASHFNEQWRMKVADSAITTMSLVSEKDFVLLAAAHRLTWWKANLRENNDSVGEENIDEKPLKQVKETSFRSIIKALALSLSRKMLAVGLSNGMIEILPQNENEIKTDLE